MDRNEDIIAVRQDLVMPPVMVMEKANDILVRKSVICGDQGIQVTMRHRLICSQLVNRPCMQNQSVANRTHAQRDPTRSVLVLSVQPSHIHRTLRYSIASSLRHILSNGGPGGREKRAGKNIWMT